MFKSVFRQAMAAVLLLATVAPSSGESLADAFVAAYRNSALLESTRALVRAEDESVASAVAALRPTLSTAATLAGTMARTAGRAGEGRSTDGKVSTALSVTAEWLVYDGGAGRLSKEAAKETVLAVRQTLLEVEQAVLMSAAVAYHDVVLGGQMLELAENALKVFETQLQAAQERFSLGEVTRTDVSLVEARLAAAQSEVFFREGELEIAKESYRLATGRYPGSLLPPPPTPSAPETLEVAKSIARHRHPSIVRGQHTVSAASLLSDQLVARYVPQVSVGGTLAANREVGAWGDGGDSATVSVTATMPIYRGGAYDSAKRRAVANLERARFELQQAARVADQNVAASWSRLRIADSSIEARRLQLEAAELALEGIKQEARLGLRTTLDILDSEQEVLAASSDLIAAGNDRSIAVYRLLEAAGLMTAQHLGLGIPTYDPDENLKRVESAPAVTYPTNHIQEVLQSLGIK